MSEADRSNPQEIIDALVEFETNITDLRPTEKETNIIESLFSAAIDEFRTPVETEHWLGFIMHASFACEKELHKTNSSAMVVVRALENYIETNRKRPSIRIR